MLDHFSAILGANRKSAELTQIGLSRGGLPILASRFGSGSRRISLLGGMHADEPVGPLFLRYFCAYLSSLPESDPLLSEYTWWIVPHGNPDGELLNSSWFKSTAFAGTVGDYLAFAQRELPGEDLEFGFPRAPDDADARPETSAIYRWWHTDSAPFSLHVSLHSMGFAGGAWFLLPPQEISSLKMEIIQSVCNNEAATLGYVLHDVERNGEKGFRRIAPGFCTHPTAVSMAEFFLARSDDETARKFRPSSMETISAFGGNPLTLVSEIPNFILPGVGLEIGPPDIIAEQWKERIFLWRDVLQHGASPESISLQAEATGIVAVPYDHQMQLQWALIVAGLEAIA
jgi:hypothetical protein